MTRKTIRVVCVSELQYRCFIVCSIYWFGWQLGYQVQLRRHWDSGSLGDRDDSSRNKVVAVITELEDCLFQWLQQENSRNEGSHELLSSKNECVNCSSYFVFKAPLGRIPTSSSFHSSKEHLNTRCLSIRECYFDLRQFLTRDICSDFGSQFRHDSVPKIYLIATSPVKYHVIYCCWPVQQIEVSNNISQSWTIVLFI